MTAYGCTGTVARRGGRGVRFLQPSRHNRRDVSIRTPVVRSTAVRRARARRIRILEDCGRKRSSETTCLKVVFYGPMILGTQKNVATYVGSYGSGNCRSRVLIEIGRNPFFYFFAHVFATCLIFLTLNKNESKFRHSLHVDQDTSCVRVVRCTL